ERREQCGVELVRSAQVERQRLVGREAGGLEHPAALAPCHPALALLRPLAAIESTPQPGNALRECRRAEWDADPACLSLSHRPRKRFLGERAKAWNVQERDQSLVLPKQ